MGRGIVLGGEIAIFNGDFYITEINGFNGVYKMGGGDIVNITNRGAWLDHWEEIMGKIGDFLHGFYSLTRLMVWQG